MVNENINVKRVEVTETKICCDCGADYAGARERCDLCEKARKQYIARNLKQAQEQLEEYFTDYEGNAAFITVLRKVDDCVSLIYIDENNECIHFKTDAIKNEDFSNISIEEILKQLINNIYEEQINWRSKVIRNWKSYSAQKVKSMALWLGRDEQNKVNRINEELVERYKIVEGYKRDVNYYKQFVCSLYYVKDNVCF